MPIYHLNTPINFTSCNSNPFFALYLQQSLLPLHMPAQLRPTMQPLAINDDLLARSLIWTILQTNKV